MTNDFTGCPSSIALENLFLKTENCHQYHLSVQCLDQETLTGSEHVPHGAPICMQSQGVRTTWRHNHWLKESLVGPWRKVQCDDEHRSQCCSHPQTWARGGVCLPSVSFTEMKSRDGLSGFLVNAGYT